MTDVLIYIADRLKGKSMFPLFRWILNLIFCTSITNAIFSQTHPDIRLPDSYDFQKIWDFFVKGHFTIPLIIFLIVYFVSQGIVTLFFMYFGDYKNFKLTKKILAYQLEKKEIQESIKNITEVSDQVAIVDLTKEKILEMYNGLKNVFSEQDLVKLKEVLDEGKTTISDNFVTLLRGLIAITIYFATIPSFGWLLFLIIVVLFKFLFLLLMLGYKLLDILPALMSKALLIENIYLDKNNQS